MSSSKIFITQAQVDEALHILKEKGPREVSAQMGVWLEEKFSRHPLWRETRPYRLGSWSRGELTSKSDIDMLFFGDEKTVLEFVNDFQREGIRIRYRVPADRNDWSVNVEAFDVLALLTAKAFFDEDLSALDVQQKMILDRGLKYKKQLFRTMMKERIDRSSRYDSITSYLEPNLKYGPGGLRDLEQGLTIYSLFSDRMNCPEVVTRLQSLKFELLKIRHGLHLLGANDVLVGALQPEISQFFEFENTHAFMSTLTRQMTDVSFYADLIAEMAQSRRSGGELAKSGVTANEVQSNDHKNDSAAKVLELEQALAMLKNDPSLQTQYFLRCQKIDVGSKKQIGKKFEKYFSMSMTDDFLQALFRSQLLAQVIRHLNRLRGHVQHDQYHRYSVDAHTLQAVREVLRVKAKPKRLGLIAKRVSHLNSEDWKVLLWTALYHDLGKGLKGDHSTVGGEMVKKDFIEMGLSLELTRQVAWMVQNHLLLSGAAFRQNPHSQKTWRELFARGVKGQRLHRLTVFTAIDIRATNPEAWNNWKERLLFDLSEAMLSPKASHLSQFLDYAEKKRVVVEKNFIENLDPLVIEGISKSVLLKDYVDCKKAKQNLPPLVFRNSKNQVWVRFHEIEDRPGLFLSYSRQLHSLGLSVQEAFVQTYADIGVYDWFRVKSTKATPQLRSMLKISAIKAASSVENLSLDHVRFQQIELVSQDEDEAILSFRGKDQRGALMAAALALYNAGLEIRSAKVHTWGRQIDDVFTVKKPEGLIQHVESLQKYLLV